MVTKDGVQIKGETEDSIICHEIKSEGVIRFGTLHDPEPMGTGCDTYMH